MTAILREEVRNLPDLEKLALVDAILMELDRPDPEIDDAWAAEVRERRAAHRAGRLETSSYAVAHLHRKPRGSRPVPR